ncbi:hypothetical protein K474DRAFT_759615 [Panus rudis PR-1116 ss-1]|nr:hypothetical protein K474DRAFT_759615 [Panus rudis PR-1116 ss-1]
MYSRPADMSLRYDASSLRSLRGDNRRVTVLTRYNTKPQSEATPHLECVAVRLSRQVSYWLNTPYIVLKKCEIQPWVNLANIFNYVQFRVVCFGETPVLLSMCRPHQPPKRVSGLVQHRATRDVVFTRGQIVKDTCLIPSFCLRPYSSVTVPLVKSSRQPPHIVVPSLNA